MKKILTLLISMLCYSAGYCQDRTFSYIGLANNDAEIKTIADTTHKTLFIAGNKVYSIGGDCICRLLDGDGNDRDDDGDNNSRLNDGAAGSRKSGGEIADRRTKGKGNKINKNGDKNNRDKDGNENDRDTNGDINNRNADGNIMEGTRCSCSKRGKILLYTREKVKITNAKIYYQGKYFSNKHFKIIQL
ncbi:hypothetical protein IM793_14770 [Pedobacter sp. MR2016-19]|uniref:hypothetical protein n=1 Tax=Pedobacter sp. MR2016-19 TaxID=2780089 RepID=UPI001874DD99|nr:hypothetical protein [Pedobacter sp. MR2016-19]MBE5320426.1 hypothetical protein [Pedobacter sp. MR2016-19]